MNIKGPDIWPLIRCIHAIGVSCYCKRLPAGVKLVCMLRIFVVCRNSTMCFNLILYFQAPCYWITRVLSNVCSRSKVWMLSWERKSFPLELNFCLFRQYKFGTLKLNKRKSCKFLLNYILPFRSNYQWGDAAPIHDVKRTTETSSIPSSLELTACTISALLSIIDSTVTTDSNIQEEYCIRN